MLPMRGHMVKAAVTLIATVVALSPARAHSFSQRLVGTWSLPNFDSTFKVTYKADHTFTSSGYALGKNTDFSSGTWRVEGPILVLHTGGREIWSTIVELRRNQMRFKQFHDTIFT